MKSGYEMKKHPFDEEMPDFLKDLKARGDGFKAPDGSFEDMENAVFARLKSAGDLDRPVLRVEKRPKLWASFIRPKAAMAYAAALALLLVAVWFVRQQTAVAPELPVASVELSEEELEAYLLENAHEFEPEQLASLELEQVPEQNDNQPVESNHSKKGKQPDVHPDDLELILDEMTDEELEQIL
ncbi:MAG: hypothetical protein IT261_09290 [Saprospiraceae bacterium]|nr:hypothetical protein [Saprospiraceae bacterium]